MFPAIELIHGKSEVNWHTSPPGLEMPSKPTQRLGVGRSIEISRELQLQSIELCQIPIQVVFSSLFYKPRISQTRKPQPKELVLSENRKPADESKADADPQGGYEISGRDWEVISKLLRVARWGVSGPDFGP